MKYRIDFNAVGGNKSIIEELEFEAKNDEEAINMVPVNLTEAEENRNKGRNPFYHEKFDFRRLFRIDQAEKVTLLKGR